MGIVTICNTGLRVTSGYVRVISYWKGLRPDYQQVLGLVFPAQRFLAADAWYSR